MALSSLVIILWNLIYVATSTTCSSTTCNLNAPYTNNEVICTESVDNCVINCINSQDCDNLIVQTSALITNINCQNSNACNSLQLICGYDDTLKTRTQCQLNCQNADSCNDINMQCNGDIAVCQPVAVSSNSFDGELNCTSTEETNQCQISCGDVGCSASTINCLSNTGFCGCIGSACNANVVINTLPPTTNMPTTSMPTTSQPTQSTTSSPTTASPTTSMPTTSMPTSSPSTSSPTTSLPTTSIPTTSMPTTSQPTSSPSYSPTTSTTTISPITTTPYRTTQSPYSSSTIPPMTTTATTESAESSTSTTSNEAITDTPTVSTSIGTMLSVTSSSTAASLIGTTEEDDNASSDILDVLLGDYLLYVIVGISSLALLLCIIIICIVRKKRKQKENSKKLSYKHANHTSTVSVGMTPIMGALNTDNNLNPPTFIDVDGDENNDVNKPRTTSALINRYIENELGATFNLAIQRNIKHSQQYSTSSLPTPTTPNDTVSTGLVETDENIKQMAAVTGTNLAFIPNDKKFSADLNNIANENDVAMKDIVQEIGDKPASPKDYIRGSLDFNTNLQRVVDGNENALDGIVHEIVEKPASPKDYLRGSLDFQSNIQRVSSGNDHALDGIVDEMAVE